MYKIQKNIPIPSKSRKKLYPFGDMEVGDSFAVPLNKNKAIIYAVSKAVKGSEKKFTRRVLANEIRIWRIK